MDPHTHILDVDVNESARGLPDFVRNWQFFLTMEVADIQRQAQ